MPIRTDGWNNILGDIAQVEQEYKIHIPIKLNQKVIETAYDECGISRRLMTEVVKDANSEGFTLKKDWEAYHRIYKELDFINIQERFDEKNRKAGGAVLVYIYEDGADKLREPLRPGKKIIKAIRSYSAFEVTPDMNSIEKDIRQKYYGEPLLFRVKPYGMNEFTVHRSKIDCKTGITTSDYSKRGKFFGNSALLPPYRALANLLKGYKDSSTNLENYTFTHMTMDGLAKLVDQKRENIVRERLRIIEDSLRIGRIALTDAKETFDRKSGSLAGVDRFLQEYQLFVAANADPAMPVSKLMGRSTGGLNSNGDGDQKDWNKRTRSYQTKEVSKNYNTFNQRLIDAQYPGLSKELPEIEFNPLEHLTLKELIEARKIQSEIDDKYVVNQIVLPEDVQNTRFKNGVYSFSMNFENLTEPLEEIDE